MVQLGLRCLTVGANPVDLKRGMEEATGTESKERTVWGEAVLRGGRVALQPARCAGAQPGGRNLDRDSGNRLMAQASVPGPRSGCTA